MAIMPVFIEEIDYELAKLKEKSSQQAVFLHIDEKHLNIIMSIIKSVTELNNCPVYLYGSRIQGKSVKYSDVDIAIDYHGKSLPDAIKSNLSSLLENSLLPYDVDIIDINTVSSDFRARIEKNFVKLI
jgi:predicted nucleotidyltransferase